MSKRKPVFADKLDKTLDGSEEWVEQLLSQGAHLSRSVPTIRTVNENIGIFLDHRVQDHIGGFQNSGNELEVPCGLERLLIGGRILEVLWLLNDIIHFLEGFGDGVNVVNIAEDDFGILVIIIGLESATFQAVCLRIHFGSCIVNDHSRIAHYGFLHICCLAYFLNHDLIFHGPVIHNTLHALRGSPNGAARILMVVAQGWQSVFGPESRTCQNLFEGDLSRKYQLFRVRVTNFVVVVLGDHLEVISDLTILRNFEIQAPPFGFL